MKTTLCIWLAAAVAAFIAIAPSINAQAPRLVTQLTDNEFDDVTPLVSGNNLVWRGFDGNDWEIYEYAASGIKKGQPFKPDARMKKIMNDALVLANASSRTLFARPRHPEWYYYPDSAWYNWLFVTGYEFETPIPEITKQGVELNPPTGYRSMDARTTFFYSVTVITPAMAMRLTGVGSQYLMAVVDADKNYFDGSKTYKVTLPKDVPAERFWSLTLYDMQTRSMLATPQRFPRAGSQSYPSPAAKTNADGSTTVYFGPQQPEGVTRGNWIQTDPEKGWFVILRLYSPLEPFFDKSWRPSEIELVE